MTIAFDAVSSANNIGNTGFSWSHTCTGSDLFLRVTILSEGGGTFSVTYNSVSMTEISIGEVGAGDLPQRMFYLVNPATGTNTVEISQSAGPPTYQMGIATSYTGVHQSSPIGTPVGASAATGAPATVNASSAVGELVIDGIGHKGGGAMSSQGGQTSRFNGLADDNEFRGGASDEAGATTVTMSWGSFGDPNVPWSIIALPLKPSGGVANNSRRSKFFLFMPPTTR